jgi:hypothetical protein
VTDRRRHVAVAALALVLIGTLIATPARWHLACGALAFVVMWLIDPPLRRGVGAPRRWLGTTFLLVAVGVWLGPRDASLLGHGVSMSGALAATTMVARALALVSLGSAALALYPPSRAVGRLRGTRLERLGEVLLVALGLVPSLIAALRGARVGIVQQNPGWARAPRRAFATAVFAVEHAATLADSVARDLSTKG